MFLPGESQEQGGLVGCCLWGRMESDTTEETQQQQQQQHRTQTEGLNRYGSKPRPLPSSSGKEGEKTRKEKEEKTSCDIMGLAGRPTVLFVLMLAPKCSVLGTPEVPGKLEELATLKFNINLTPKM